MTRQIVGYALVFVACGGENDYAPSSAAFELRLDTIPGTMTGGGLLMEYDIPSLPGCLGGPAIIFDGTAGVLPPRLLFSDRAVGTSTIMGLSDFHFSRTDSHANAGEATDEWRGTLVIENWEANLVKLQLIDGEICPLHVITSEPECTPADGTFWIRGERGKVSDLDAHKPGQNAKIDVQSGEPLCLPKYPD